MDTLSMYELPPGKYFIGDVSYFLTDEFYSMVKENLFHKTAHHILNGKKTLTLMKTHADTHGYWFGSNDEIYYVNAGIIGICSADMGDNNGIGSQHDFTESVTVDIRQQGVMKVVSGPTQIIIDTTVEPVIHNDDEGYDSYS